MKKTEFLNKLREELERRNVADAADILEEYEQHFGLKLADGFFEEEIAARLGDPAILAAQFDETERAPQKESGSKPLTVIGLGFADVFAGLFFLLLAGFGIVLAAAALSFGVAAVCHPRTAARHALLVRRDSGVESAGAYGAVRGRLRLLRCVPAPADPLLRALPAQRDGQRVRFGRAAAAAHQPAVFRQSKAPPARHSADLTGAVRRLFRSVLCGVCPVRRKSPVLACMGLVRELR